MKKWNKVAAFMIAVSICVSMNVAASAAMPGVFFSELQKSADHAELLSACPHAWTSSAVGSEFYEWDESDKCIHRYQTFMYVCLRCGDYYYSDVDLGPA